MNVRSDRWRSAVTLLAATALLLTGLPARGADPAVTVSFLGVHGEPGTDEARVLDVARWVALSLEDAKGMAFRDLDLAGPAVVARRDVVLTEVFLDAARKELIGGQKLFEAARMEEARESFERARQLLDRNAEYLRDPALAVDIDLYSGLVASWDGDAPGADRRFALAAALDPGRVLDPVRFPEEEIARFQRARDQVVAAKPARVTIGKEAQGMDVLLDGRAAGKAPLTLEVRPGRHFVGVVGADGRRAAAVVEAKAGEDLQPELAPSRAGLRPVADPDEPEGKQSRRTEALYAQLARAAGTDVILFAGFDLTGNFRLQAYSRRDGRFTRPQVADVLLSQRGPDGIVQKMVDRLVSSVRPDGTLEEDAVGTAMTPLYLGRNAVLNALLLGPGWSTALGHGSAQAAAIAPRTPLARRPWFWAILGGVAAAAGVGIGVGVSQSQSSTTSTSDTGVVTISFGSGG